MSRGEPLPLLLLLLLSSSCCLRWLHGWPCIAAPGAAAGLTPACAPGATLTPWRSARMAVAEAMKLSEAAREKHGDEEE